MSIPDSCMSDNFNYTPHKILPQARRGIFCHLVLYGVCRAYSLARKPQTKNLPLHTQMQREVRKSCIIAQTTDYGFSDSNETLPIYLTRNTSTGEKQGGTVVYEGLKISTTNCNGFSGVEAKIRAASASVSVLKSRLMMGWFSALRAFTEFPSSRRFK